MSDLRTQVAIALRNWHLGPTGEWDDVPKRVKAVWLGKADAEIQALTAAGLAVGPVESFQARVAPWMQACFGPEISADRIERNHRFLEEALELVQANDCTEAEAHQLVDYVYGRPDGDVNQEVGGVMVTLAALCLAVGEDMHEAAERELARVWTKIEKIRAKQAAKPRNSPLPEFAATARPSIDAEGRQGQPEGEG